MRSAAPAFARFFCVCLVAVIAPRTLAEPTFPFTAYVDDHSAVVRSGPGTDFYATDSLTWATKVEVYRHEDAEWAAIRPPSSSFSWISANNVSVSDSPELAVVESTIKTMIGSQLNRRFDVEFVTLRAGDVVEILGQADLDLGDGDGPQRCYKILPPAGEFRWIRRSQLAIEPPLQPTSETQATNFTTADEPQHEIALAQYESTDAGGNQDVPLELLEPPQVPSGNAIRSPELPSGSSTSEPLLLPDSGGPDVSSQLGSPGRGSASAGQDAPPQFGLPAAGEFVPPQRNFPAASAPSRRMPLGPTGRMRLGQELTDIELQLTQQVAQPPETWQLSDLRVRARAVIDTSDQAEHRATAQRIIAKIAQMEDVKRRNAGLLEEQDRLARRTLANNRYAYQDYGGAPARSDRYLAEAESAAGSNYDGVGWLMPVVTEHPSIPRYVLTDAEGNIKQFVSPKPGMNLSRFEQKRIGIYGQRGHLPTYDQPHLMAERIISLDKVR